ncbi:MAG: helix-turn-helix domain-containing protein [Acidimicrobiales bacterium]
MNADTTPTSPTRPSDPIRLAPRPIDLVDDRAVMATLGVSRHELCELVEEGRLAAYDLGGNLRFRALDVAALAAQRHFDDAA